MQQAFRLGVIAAAIRAIGGGGGSFDFTNAFTYTGADQTWTVPPGITQIRIRQWGAGGAAGFDGNVGIGGAGGFVSSVHAVTPGDVLTIKVGQGGIRATTGTRIPGLGGGRSDVILAGSSISIAGAGGGSSGYGTTTEGNGGEGGGLTGSVGYPTSFATAGGGGTQSAGGAGGDNANGSTDGGLKQGGQGTGSGTLVAGMYPNGGRRWGLSERGGGGGDGYYGGGGGGGTGAWGAAGGGGSSFSSGTSVTHTKGTRNVAPATGEAGYVAGVAAGGYDTDGGNGLVLIDHSSKIVFGYTGADQTIVVPAGMLTATVKMWGGGGSGANRTPIGLTDGGPGGGAGYTTAKIAVVPGETLTVIVGRGGQNSPSGAASGTVYGGGGSGDGGGDQAAGGGGGRAAIRRSSTELLTAPGGGGGGSVGQQGGVGGGLTGGNGVMGSGSFGGIGGTQTAGGAAGSFSGGDTPTAGSAFTGGNGGGPDGAGGGGGGGYYGGGGAGGSGSSSGGGGGGSGFAGDGSTTVTLTSGSGVNPGNSGDGDRGGGNVGVGGGDRTAGGNALVQIVFSTDPGEVHRYWRLSNFTGVSGSGFEITEIELREGATNRSSGVTPTASVPGSGSAVSFLTNGVLNANSCFWSVAEANTLTIDFDLTTARRIDSARIARYDTAGRFPTSVTVSWSDNGSSWTSLGAFAVSETGIANSSFVPPIRFP